MWVSTHAKLLGHQGLFIEWMVEIILIRYLTMRGYLLYKNKITEIECHKNPTSRRKFAPATRQSISSSLSKIIPSLSLKRSAYLYAPPPVACSSIAVHS